MRDAVSSVTTRKPKASGIFTPGDLKVFERVLSDAITNLPRGDAAMSAAETRGVLAVAIFAHAKGGLRDPAALKRLALADLASVNLWTSRSNPRLSGANTLGIRPSSAA